MANRALIDEFANRHSLCSAISPIWPYSTRLAWASPSTHNLLLRDLQAKGEEVQLINYPSNLSCEPGPISPVYLLPLLPQFLSVKNIKERATLTQ